MRVRERGVGEESLAGEGLGADWVGFGGGGRRRGGGGKAAAVVWRGLALRYGGGCSSVPHHGESDPRLAGEMSTAAVGSLPR